jgi:hypothetical protein
MDMNKFSLVTSLSEVTMKFFFRTCHLGFNHPQLTPTGFEYVHLTLLVSPFGVGVHATMDMTLYL